MKKLNMWNDFLWQKIYLSVNRNDLSQKKKVISLSGSEMISFSGKEDAANNFARGHYTVGKEVIDMVGWLQLYF